MRRPVDAQMPEVVETDGDGAAALTEGRVQIHAQARDRGAFHRIGGAGRQRRQALLRFRQLAGEELAFGPIQFEREDELVPAFPAILRQQRRTGDEIAERRGVGGRSLGSLAGDQVELGELLTFLPRRDQRRAAVELVDDLEDRLLKLRPAACAPPAAGRSAGGPRPAMLPGSANRRLPAPGRG